MSDDLRLYFFECGSLRTAVRFIKTNQGLGEPYEIPVPFPNKGPMMLTADACCTMDHYNEAALPGLIQSAADVASSTRKVRRVVEGHGATLVTGHDPKEGPKFKKPPDPYA